MFKRNLFLFFIIAMSSAIIYPKSRVIISGKSSIMIESENNNTKLIASEIETISGGILKKTVGQNTNSEAVTEISADFGDGLPTEFVIEKAYPNPFNPTTRIRYGVPTNSNVNVSIYDMAGRLVNNYKIGNKTSGWHEFNWQGTDAHGQQVSTGMYLVTMRAGQQFQKQKITFLK